MNGYVYILTNSSLPGIVKIGMTTNSPHDRAAQLSTTGLPHPFKVFGYVEVGNPRDIERRIHKKLYKNRVSKKREFFKISPQSALSLLEDVTGESEVMRKERAKRLERNKKERIEKEKKEEHRKIIRNEWSIYLNKLQGESSHSALVKISDYVGKFGWAFFYVAVLIFFVEKEDIAMLVFLLSLAVGSFSSLFDILADRKWNKLKDRANNMMIEKHGENWDSF